MDIIGHRGASYAAPENTLASFKLAWAEGADGIEGDFYLCKDGHIVCIHDKNTKRVAKQNLSVTQSTLAELRTLDVGSWKDPRFAEERIPTLEEVIATIPAGKKLFIEIKDDERMVPHLQQVLETTGVKPEQIRIIAFSLDVIRSCKAQLPEIKASWLVGKKQLIEVSLSGVLQTAKGVDFEGIGLEQGDHINADLVKAIHDAGIELHTWTGNSGADARRYRSLGLKSVTTDKPGYILGELK
ncbi:MAG: glycerophosphoryl diester phosphodiesterase [Candidatus Omnitrophota bacterium]|jgi:glycerophosphoryl diester phosphodiesterase